MDKLLWDKLLDRLQSILSTLRTWWFSAPCSVDRRRKENILRELSVTDVFQVGSGDAERDG